LKSELVAARAFLWIFPWITPLVDDMARLAPRLCVGQHSRSRAIWPA
jgi:hypothetical protein